MGRGITMAGGQLAEEDGAEAERTTGWSDDKFRADRSNAASKIAYDLAKSICQTCLLMNGGAATAVLAALEKLSPSETLRLFMVICVTLYGFGVAASAVMMFCMMQTADNWNYAWYSSLPAAYDEEEDDEGDIDPDYYENIAYRWHRAYYFAFVAALVLFLAASGILAYAFVVHGGTPPTSSETLGPA